MLDRTSLLVLLLIGSLALAGCGRDSTTTSAPTATSIPAASPVTLIASRPTPTVAPSPTLTPTDTPSPKLIPTATPEPTLTLARVTGLIVDPEKDGFDLVWKKVENAQGYQIQYAAPENEYGDYEQVVFGDSAIYVLLDDSSSPIQKVRVRAMAGPPGLDILRSTEGATFGPWSEEIVVERLAPAPAYTDDHANGPDGATVITFGEKQTGYLDDDDHDVFQFKAEAGFIYELSLTPDLLSDNWADLTLNIRDSHYDNLSIFYAYEEEPEIFKWMAETSGTYYLNLSSFDEGSYELQVDITDLRDDRPNSIAAMDGWVGGPSDGSPVSVFPAVLEYHDDIDFFRFDATVGNLYKIEVLGDDLEDALIEVYGREHYPFDSNEDCEEPYLYWTPVSTGAQYISVSSTWSIGSYSLSISLVDDLSSRVAPLVDFGPGFEYIGPDLWALLYKQALGEEVPERLDVYFEWSYYGYEEEQEILDAIKAAGGVQKKGPERDFYDIPTSAILPILQLPDVYAAEIYTDLDIGIPQAEGTPVMDETLRTVIKAYRGGVPADQAVLYAMFVRNESMATYIQFKDSETMDAAVEWLEHLGLYVPEKEEYEGDYWIGVLLPVGLVDQFVEEFPGAYLSVEEFLGQGLGYDRFYWPRMAVCFELGLMSYLVPPEELRSISFRGIELADLCCFDPEDLLEDTNS